MDKIKSIDSENKVSIAIAGHTNTGKTTLIRTLMKTTIGEVGDSANVTKVGQSYYYDGLQANFIDTPGLRFASIYNTFLEERRENPEYKMTNAIKNKIKHDLDTIKQIKKSNIALYVANLTIVPDDGHIEEIQVVKTIQPRVIAILNKYDKELKASSKEKVDQRVEQWKNTLSKNQVLDIIIFDAHRDKFSKVRDIYEAIDSNLKEADKKIFQDGLTVFKRRQQEIQIEACSLLADCIKKIQEIKVITTREEYLQSKQKIEKEIYDHINTSFTDFWLNVNYLYKIASEYPTKSKEDLQTFDQDKINFMARCRDGGAGTALLGISGLVVGGVLGGIIGGIFTGGTAIGPSAIIGSRITALVASLLGVSVVFDDNPKDQKAILVSGPVIEKITIQGLSIIWNLSITGYGRNLQVTEDEIKEFQDGIKSLIQNKGQSLDWTKVDKTQIIDTSQHVLQSLEKIYQTG